MAARTKKAETVSSKPAIFDLHAVEVASAQMPTPEALREAVTLLRALGDPTRAAIVLALKAVAEICVSDLANICSVTLHVASTHLRVLRAHGLVRQRSEGRMTYYSLADERLEAFTPSFIRGFGTPQKRPKNRGQP